MCGYEVSASHATRCFIQYSAGILGIRLRNGYFPRNGTSCSPTMMSETGMITFGNWATYTCHMPRTAASLSVVVLWCKRKLHQVIIVCVREIAECNQLCKCKDLWGPMDPRGISVKISSESSTLTTWCHACITNRCTDNVIEGSKSLVCGTVVTATQRCTGVHWTPRVPLRVNFHTAAGWRRLAVKTILLH